MAQPLDAPVPEHDPRPADLQAQIDDLRLALLDWRRSREHSQPTEDRLAQITLQCARMVDTWQDMERRRSGSIASFDPSRGVENRLHQTTGERLRALERAIEHEWNTLPQGRDEMSRQLGEHAASLGDTRATANLTLRGLAGVETRLTALEQDLQAGMAQLSRELQSVVAELRNAQSPRQPGTPSAFPLESVMRIHDELRESDTAPNPAQEALKAGAVRALPEATEMTTALTARVESLERAVSSVAEATDLPRSGWRPLYSIIGMLVVIAAVALFGLWMQRRVDARLSDAAQRVEAAERQRDATTAAIRAEAARDVADARESAAQAQIVSNVLAAPDLVRYWLTGVDGNSRAYAQVLFSRSRGLVFSASRLEPAGAGRTYQLWLLTAGEPVNAGLITPDSAGRVTFATDVPLTVPSRLTGALVTAESTGGAAAPSGDRALVRVQ